MNTKHLISGAKVRLVTGGPVLTVDQAAGGLVSCFTSSKDGVSRQIFRASALEVVSEPSAARDDDALMSKMNPRTQSRYSASLAAWGL
jgi:uncharacterized protein YodC (DUF2158 family)